MSNSSPSNGRFSRRREDGVEWPLSSGRSRRGPNRPGRRSGEQRRICPTTPSAPYGPHIFGPVLGVLALSSSGQGPLGSGRSVGQWQDRGSGTPRAPRSRCHRDGDPSGADRAEGGRLDPSPRPQLGLRESRPGSCLNRADRPRRCLPDSRGTVWNRGPSLFLALQAGSEDSTSSEIIK